MADDTQTGKPEPDGGDAAEHTPTTDAQDAAERTPTADQDAGATEEHRAWKEKAERAQAELADLKSRQPPPPVAAGTEGTAQADAYLESVQKWAAEGDPFAIGLLAERQQREELIRELIHVRQLDRIPEESERSEILTHFNKNRHRLGDIDAARAEVRERKLAADNAKLREDLKRLNTKPDLDVLPPRLPRDVTTTEAKARRMTRDDWNREQKSLDEAGLHKEKMRRQLELRNGKIVLGGS